MKHFNLLIKCVSGVIFYTTTPSVTFAQHQSEDKEIQLNMDAVKMIQFDFNSPVQLDNKPKEAPLNKKWQEFKTDIGIPRSLLDTTKVKKPNNYVRMLPYTIWTRFGEDPVYDVLVFQREKKLEMTWSIGNTYKEEYGRTLLPTPGQMYETASKAFGSGAVLRDLDINKFLTDNLTRRGRMLRRNRKHATAWKNYQNYKPTIEDSLKMPNFYRRTTLLPIIKDSTKVEHDSIHIQQHDSTRTKSQDNSSWYQYIQQKVKEDSIQKQNPTRKKDIRQNAYDIDRQLKRLKELQN